MKLYRVEFKYQDKQTGAQDIAVAHVACESIDKAESYALEALKKEFKGIRTDYLSLMAVHLLEKDLFIEGSIRKSPIVFKET